MRKILLLFGLFLMTNSVYSKELIHENNDSCISSGNSNSDILNSQFNNVIVCDGQYAFAYHSFADCRGLNNCRGKLYQITEYDAINVYNRKPCCICWIPRPLGCAEDGQGTYGNSGGGGSGGEEVIAGLIIVAAVVIVTGAILIANDMQISPLISFYKDKLRYNSNNVIVNKSIGTGFTFQFRKNFKNSGIEYGINYINFRRELLLDYGYGILVSNIEDLNVGFHINYIHDIFINKTPDKYNIFIGPTFNYINDLGFGFILGGRYKLTDRLKLDARYELSTQTNHLQVGISYLFQKKYFWQKNK